MYEVYLHNGGEPVTFSTQREALDFAETVTGEAIDARLWIEVSVVAPDGTEVYHDFGFGFGLC